MNVVVAGGSTAPPEAGTFLGHPKGLLMLAGIGALAGAVLFIMNRPLDRIVGGHDCERAPGLKADPAR